MFEYDVTYSIMENVLFKISFPAEFRTLRRRLSLFRFSLS